ncbi:MAG TPA: hypothetical protein VMP01_14945 [Pirellulaceae bacterium]|nr:hypothetical protein [Pirellulaceae bacterium]
MPNKTGRFQFSLRALLGVTTIVCIWAGLIGFNVNQFQTARNSGTGPAALGVLQMHAIAWCIAGIVALIFAWNVSDRENRTLAVLVAALSAIGFAGNSLLLLGAF